MFTQILQIQQIKKLTFAILEKSALIDLVEL